MINFIIFVEINFLKKMKYAILLIILLSFFLVSSCTKESNDNLNEIILIVASEKKTVIDPVSLEEIKIMQVKLVNSTNWINLYSEIAGFEYVAGYEYTLKVLREEIKEPVQDGSSHAYKLIQIINKRLIYYEKD